MFIFGLKVSLIGIGIVFAALVFLIFVINAISFVTKTLEAKIVDPAGKKPEAAVNNLPSKLTAASQDETEIIAVISAAIAAYSQNTVGIRTITRILGSSAPAWSNAGRLDTMNLRQI